MRNVENIPLKNTTKIMLFHLESMCKENELHVIYMLLRDFLFKITFEFLWKKSL